MGSTSKTLEELGGPDPADVEALTGLLCMTAHFASNEQRARFLLSSYWMRERGTAAAHRAATMLAEDAAKDSPL